ncbi:MAG: hypothetical protein Q9159_002574 [Coniocarpon cinnabarinum]
MSKGAYTTVSVEMQFLELDVIDEDVPARNRASYQYVLESAAEIPVLSEELEIVERRNHPHHAAGNPFHYGGLYDSENDTATNEAWDALPIDYGSVAIDHDVAQSYGLPRAQNFPWDEFKGLYFLNAFHGVHCLKDMRKTMLELHSGKPLSHGIGHVMHCFESLLEDVTCLADDTPRVTLEEHPGKSGFNQVRQCRSWSRLESFAREHTSCWRYINPNQKIDTLLRYRYCPEGSPYNERIHAIFGDFDKGSGASAET